MSIKLFVKYEEVSEFPCKFCIRESQTNLEFNSRYELLQYLEKKYGYRTSINSQELLDKITSTLKVRKPTLLQRIKNYKSDFNKLKRTNFIKMQIV